MANLSDIARGEVFFTVNFYLACNQNRERFLELISKQLKLDSTARIVDMGFEVCLLRDYAMKFKTSRHGPDFEKQTFDAVFILDNGTLIILEGKAHQPFNNAQIEKLHEARKLILKNNFCFGNVQILDVKLVGLHSSIYKPRESTKKQFDAMITWDDLGEIFPDYTEIFSRANGLYNDRAS